MRRSGRTAGAWFRGWQRRVPVKAALRVVLLSFAVPVLWARPAQVLLLRHAEKPAERSNLHLSQRGRERAQALASFLTTNELFLQHGAPAALFAVKVTPRGHGQRPTETLAPLAARLQLPIQTPFASDDHSALAAEILRNPAYEGKTVIICWVHEFLPELARDFGGKPKPKKWDGDRYDRIWLLTLDERRTSLKSLPQRLLPGDAAQ